MGGWFKKCWVPLHDEKLPREEGSTFQPSQTQRAFIWVKSWPLCPSHQRSLSFDWLLERSRMLWLSRLLTKLTRRLVIVTCDQAVLLFVLPRKKKKRTPNRRLSWLWTDVRVNRWEIEKKRGEAWLHEISNLRNYEIGWHIQHFRRTYMVSSEHNGAYISLSICTNRLAFNKWTFFVLFSLDVPTYPIILQI